MADGAADSSAEPSCYIHTLRRPGAGGLGASRRASRCTPPRTIAGASLTALNEAPVVSQFDYGTPFPISDPRGERSSPGLAGTHSIVFPPANPRNLINSAGARWWDTKLRKVIP